MKLKPHTKKSFQYPVSANLFDRLREAANGLNLTRACGLQTRMQLIPDYPGVSVHVGVMQSAQVSTVQTFEVYKLVFHKISPSIAKAVLYAIKDH